MITTIIYLSNLFITVTATLSYFPYISSIHPFLLVYEDVLQSPMLKVRRRKVYGLEFFWVYKANYGLKCLKQYSSISCQLSTHQSYPYKCLKWCLTA